MTRRAAPRASSAHMTPPVPPSARAACSATAEPTCSGVAAPESADVTPSSACRWCGESLRRATLTVLQGGARRPVREEPVGRRLQPRAPAPVALRVGPAGGDRPPCARAGAALDLDAGHVARADL